MDISFIILNYKSKRYLANCIASIEKHASDLEREIIIVNNDAEQLENTWGFRHIRIVNNKTNEGFSSACNKGAKIAEGDSLFFLNPDTEIKAGEISNLISRLEDESVGIVAPRLALSSGETQPWSAGDEINLLSILKNKSSLTSSSPSKTLLAKDSNTEVEVSWVSGAAFAIKKSMFDNVCGFDENFFMYFEDVDLCKRIRKIGKKIFLFPSIVVMHIGGQSFSDAKEQKTLYYKSQDYYFKKHFGGLQSFALKFLRSVLLFFKA